MVGHLELRDDFKEQAEWRREKAEQYPDDKRHLEAAAIFDRLAATVDAIPQDVYRIFAEAGVNDGLLDVERWTEMLRDVTKNRRGIRPIFCRGSDDATRISRPHGCSPLSNSRPKSNDLSDGATVKQRRTTVPLDSARDFGVRASLSLFGHRKASFVPPCL